MFHHGELERHNVANVAAAATNSSASPVTRAIAIAVAISNDRAANSVATTTVIGDIQRSVDEHLRRRRSGRVRNMCGERLRRMKSGTSRARCAKIGVKARISLKIILKKHGKFWTSIVFVSVMKNE